MLKRQRRKAFTLVELIVVIVILAVLAAIAFMVLTKMIGKSRDSRRVADLSTISKALQTYLISADSVKTLPVNDGSTARFVSGYIATGSLSVRPFVQVGPFNNAYFTLLRNSSMDSLAKLSKDPKGMPYVIAIYTGTKADFTIAATLENKDADTVGNKSAVDGNVFNKTFVWGTGNITLPTAMLNGKYFDGAKCSSSSLGDSTDCRFVIETTGNKGEVSGTPLVNSADINNNANFITDGSTTTYPYAH